jgi:predicted HAD superfamily Cof-like phosphohydrolase
MKSKFSEQITQFNSMYRLPTSDTPTLSQVGDWKNRLVSFKKTIGDEVTEVDDIVSAVDAEDIDTLTNIADWLGDLQVYAASEMAKFGLDNDVILDIIMRSNFSKQNTDGSTSYDEHGKVLKGPNYYKPEPEICAYIAQAIQAK